VRCAAVNLDVLVATVLVGKAAQECLTRQTASDVANTVFAFFGRSVCKDTTIRNYVQPSIKKLGRFTLQKLDFIIYLDYFAYYDVKRRTSGFG
jgi:hypothetical protein